ncbi:MAG: 30S ribosomal protein S12 methylthiotransferase RimO [Butyrivibrio sp.]|nr:30S ribosomal protein S12 methylthiotransferase RimO [Butyrivibrio sp.]
MKILFVSLGCDKNRVDSEIMLGMLAKRGHEFVDDETEAEAAVINTCCFISDAKEESVNTILEFANMKNEGHIKVLIVTGCLAQRYKNEILEEIPEVDEIVGTTAIDKIIDAVDAASANKSGGQYLESIDREATGNHPRVQTTGGMFNYLRIAEGCDKNCTYCIIPKVRGHYRSVPMEQLISEAEGLAEQGVTELILIAQETTLYGTDLYGEKKLPELLKKLCKIEGLKWIRLMYCYPEEITDELIAVMRDEPKICHYIDMPVQSGADAVLKRMGRKTNRAEIEEIVRRLRENIPDICIRTTLITGFPGETAADHRETMEFVRKMRFDRLGAFTYSMEEDTPAARMREQISERIKKTRKTKIMKLQQEIAFEEAEAMVGRTVKAVIEGRITDADIDSLTYVGRTYKDAPDIDGYLFINGADRELITGDFVSVRITGSHEYDLIGELCDESAE